jgi:hypothetical protein
MTRPFLVLIASLGFSSQDQPIAAHPIEATPVLYSYEDLVARLTNLEHVAELPAVGALRALTVSMSWDRETNPSVWAPPGDFFGAACGYIPYTALPLGMQSNGWMYCYWYTPFASRAQIVIGNDGNVTRNVEVAISGFRWQRRL